MRFVFCKILLIILLLTFLTNAQNHSAFQTFTIGAIYSVNVNEEKLHNYWSSGSGFEGFLSTPFYLGKLQAGLSFMPFSGKSDEYPDYNSFLFYVQWGYEFSLPMNFFISVDALTGINQMSFKETSTVTIDQGVTSEKEIVAGLSSTLSYEIFTSWKLNLSASYKRTFTEKRIDLINISFGLSKTFNSPVWLKDFLE